MAPYQLQQHDARTHTRAQARHTRRHATNPAQTTPRGAGDGRADCATRTHEEGAIVQKIKLLTDTKIKYPALHAQASMLKLFSGDVDVPGQLVQMVAAEVGRQSFRREHAHKDRLSTVTGKFTK